MTRLVKKLWPRAAIFTVIAVITAVTAVSLWLFVYQPAADGRSNDLQKAQLDRNDAMPPAPELQLYKPITAEQAEQENDDLPFSSAPIEKALPLTLPESDLLAIGRRNAIDCLTSAIYYEAGYESDQGRRAVAQVVLNRVRHPAFPNSICGVIYEGSERRTGCQFTFTCDGSIGRRPARASWESARKIATDAISGTVETSVGMATHYHANYVLPYWAPSLSKIAQVGSHIFYRWKGAWGKRAAFVQMVRLDEQEPLATLTDEILVGLENDIFTADIPIKPPSRIIADEGLSVAIASSPGQAITSAISPQIRADEQQSVLTVDRQQSTLKLD